MNDVYKMKKSDFLELPLRRWDEDIGPFGSLVIIPTRRKHDSGYMCMDFAAVRQRKAICRLSGCSDVIHIGGIGGRGKRNTGEYRGLMEAIGWSVDCLPCGLLQLFANGKILTAGAALSSFEVFAESREALQPKPPNQ